MRRLLHPGLLTRRIAELFLFVTTFAACAQETVVTLAGVAGTNGFANGPATQALFNDPAGLAFDANGNLFIADNRNHVIRKLAPDNTVSTFAGLPGTAGAADGTGSVARFDSPTGISVAPDGTIYVTDTGNHTIRRITPAGVVTTFAGMAGEGGFTNGVGSEARFNSPLGIALDLIGNLYVADSGNHVIRKITPAGEVSTLAGTPEFWGSADGIGTNAQFNCPAGIAMDTGGNLFVSDSANHTIRKITPDGHVSTLAGLAGVDGSADGPGNLARFSKPAELVISPQGNLFVADSFTHTLRRVAPDGNVTTVAGVAGEDGAVDGEGAAARFFNPYGLALDNAGNLRVSDSYNQTLRLVLASIHLDVEFVNGVTTLSWNSVPGSSYQVQFRDNLSAGVWQNLGSPAVASDITTTRIDNAGTAQRFYRVQLLP